MTKPKETDELDIPPGDEPEEAYQATGPKRGGGALQFLWFVTADRRNDFIFPIADIRRMAPPNDLTKEVAWIHFSGVDVVLTGTNLRRVLHRIAMHRCVSVHQIRPGQTRSAKGEPVIETMDFIDLTKAVPKASKAN